MEQGTICFARTGNVVILKLTGKVRYQMGASLDDYLDHLFARGDFEDILIDLTETRMIDSTCLGLLARIANYTHDRFGRKSPIFYLHDDIDRILKGVGFPAVFNIIHGNPKIAAEMESIAVCDENRDELAKTLYNSHRILCDLNEKNRAAFQNILDVLREDVPSILHPSPTINEEQGKEGRRNKK
jgi:anti-anti-sigma factor